MKELEKKYCSKITYKDIVYKKINNNNLLLDVLMPVKERFLKTPVIIYVHGGGWIEGNRTMLLHNSRELIVDSILENGYAIIVIEYRLLDGKTVFPANISDVKDSIRWVRNHAKEYNFDEKNIGIWGNSAGAHLALVAAYSPEEQFTRATVLAKYATKVNYVIDINGPIELKGILDVQPSEAQVKRVKQFFDNTIPFAKISEIEWKALQFYFPIAYVQDEAKPTFILQGGLDSERLKNNSRKLHSILLKQGIDTTYMEIPNAEHDLPNVQQEELMLITEAIIAFIEKHTK